MKGLKQKTISGLVWSFIDNFSNLGIQFVVGIILARILTPREFGLIGMITIFIAISQSIVDSGFSQALIRKNNCTRVDYSTVFYFNFLVGILIYILLTIFAPIISKFFDEPELTTLIRVLAVVVVVDAFTIIQRTILTKRIDFKLQTRISIIASVIAGIIAIWLATEGYGVWSLVALQISRQVINSMLLWIWNKWLPLLYFSKESFKDLFGFGSKLLISGIIDTVYRNVYLLVIGKYFSATELGFYTRADQFNNLASQNVTNVIQRVSYPVLASMQSNQAQLKINYQKIIRNTMFITFNFMIGMAAVAKPMIIILIGTKWLPSVIYLQMLCFVGMFYPLHAINLNMLKVQGRSDLFLKLEIVKKILAVPIIILGVVWGINAMIIGMIFNSLISYYLNSYWSGKFIGYSFRHQIRDILPSFGLALSMGFFVYSIGMLPTKLSLWTLIFQIISGVLFVITVGEIIKHKDYTYLKKLTLEKIISFKKQKNGKFK